MTPTDPEADTSPRTWQPLRTFTVPCGARTLLSRSVSQLLQVKLPLVCRVASDVPALPSLSITLAPFSSVSWLEAKMASDVGGVDPAPGPRLTLATSVRSPRFTGAPL